MICALVVHQYRTRHPLMPVRQIATTFPVTALVIVMFASSAAFGLIDLLLAALQNSATPAHVALELLPEFGAAIVTAALLECCFVRVHPGARRLRPGSAHRRGGTAHWPGHRRWAGGGRGLGAHWLGCGRVGVPGAVHGRVLPALGPDPAGLRPGGTAPRGYRVPGRADPAVPGHRDRNKPGGGGQDRDLDLLGHRGRRHDHGGCRVHARRQPAANARRGAVERGRACLGLTAVVRPVREKRPQPLPRGAEGSRRQAGDPAEGT